MPRNYAKTLMQKLRHSVIVQEQVLYLLSVKFVSSYLWASLVPQMLTKIFPA